MDEYPLSHALSKYGTRRSELRLARTEPPFRRCAPVADNRRPAHPLIGKPSDRKPALQCPSQSLKPFTRSRLTTVSACAGGDTSSFNLPPRNVKTLRIASIF